MSDELGSKLSSAERRADQVERDLALDGVDKEINGLSDLVHALPQKVEAVRDRGYVFRAYLENKVEVLGKHWSDIQARAFDALDDQRRALRNKLYPLQRLTESAKRATSESTIVRLEEALGDFEKDVKEAEERVRTVYSTLKKDAESTSGQVNEITTFLDLRDAASFDFLAGESLYMVTRAEWAATGKGKDDPDGYLYLTDQRMIFEQDEKVGKKLGMFGGKAVKELEWEVQLNQIESVEFENKGMFGGKDMLNFTLGSGAPYSKITVEVKGGADNKFWVAQIQRMIAGETSDERAIPPSPEMLDAIRNAPTECHVCGATLPKLVANQMQIECEYCGSVIRL